VYTVRGKFKLTIGVAKGKKEYDKREATKNRDIDIDNRRIVKSQKLS
jgi:tmRNA-binding protein